MTKKKKPTKKKKRIPVPELGMDVFVRRMGTKERDTFEAALIESRDEDGNFFYKWIPGRIEGLLLARTIVDEDGNRVYSDEEAGKLGYGHSDVKYRIYREALYINGLGPKPDHKKDRVKVSPRLKEHFPGLADMAERFPMLFPNFGNNPTNIFKKKYKEKYRPGTTARDFLLSALPHVKDDERLAAAERFIGDRSPMNKGRISEHRAAIWNDLGITSFQEEKATIKRLGIESLFPSIARMREALGIFAPEEEMVRTVRKELNDETTFNALPREAHKEGAWRKKSTPDDPELRRGHEESIAYDLGDSGIKGLPSSIKFKGMPPPRWWEMEDDFDDFGDLDSELDTAPSGEEAAIAAKAELDRLKKKLAPRQRRYLNAYLEAEGDYDRAAKSLRVKPETLKDAIYRIRVAIKGEKPSKKPST